MLIPGKLYRLTKTEWCEDFRDAFVIRVNLENNISEMAPGYHLSCDTMMFICCRDTQYVFSQGNDIFIFYHDYVRRTLQEIT